ncbi:hypothetical protein RS9916_39666 [Synechococcus sp. RS9916]|nr:hypothetical protein RS9916_39666 [Synechococcus sp. RS9916]
MGSGGGETMAWTLAGFRERTMPP